MTISERDRHEMHTALRQAIGESEADTLMEHLPPVGWADVVTKRDLEQEVRALRHELGERMERGFRRVIMWMAGLVVGGLIAGMGVAATIGRNL